MNIELSQDMANVLSYAISSRGSTVEELLDMLNYEFSNDPMYPTGADPVSEYPEEVKSAFGSANDGVMYDDYLRYLSGSVQRSSLDNQMENTMRITETKLRRVLRAILLEAQGAAAHRPLRKSSRRKLNEHLHGYKGKTNEKYMTRPIPEEAKQLPYWDEWEEEFRMTKEAIDGNYRKMTSLSIDYPKMNTRNVDEDAMDYKHYHQMSATEKYVYCKNELLYLWEDLIRLWKELDEELGIEDGFAGY